MTPCRPMDYPHRAAKIARERALKDAGPEMLEALKAAGFVFGLGSSATPQQQQDAAERITAVIAKVESPG